MRILVACEESQAATYSGIAEAMADQWSNVDQWTMNGSQLSLPTIA